MDRPIDIDEAFYVRMRRLLGDGYGQFIDALSRPAAKGVRVNTLKISADEFAALSPFELRPNPLCPEGFFASGDGFGKHPYHAAGLYYMQEPSAMTVAPLLYDCLDSLPCPRVLDMCAAPGGKTGQLAAHMRGRGYIVANEFVYPRAQTLVGTVERLGITNCAVTCARPDKVAACFGGAFDAVAADVPCSGEGMLRKGDGAAKHWSEKNVAACAARAAEILDSCDKCLVSGGLLAFSTCTFSVEENEQQCETFAQKYGYKIEFMRRLYPHTFDGEGHFMCLMRKLSKSEDSMHMGALTPCGGRAAQELTKLCGELSSADLCGTVVRQGDALYIVPPALSFGIPLPVLRQGVRAADIIASKDTAAKFRAAKGGREKPPKKTENMRLIPHHHLAMTVQKSDIKSGVFLSCGDSLLRDYLSGLAVDVSDKIFKASNSGRAIMCCDNYPVGLCKITDGIAKNHYPKGLRF